jgi:hypothetical protein
MIGQDSQDGRGLVYYSMIVVGGAIFALLCRRSTPRVKTMGIELVYALGAILLLGALVWGANHYRGRRRGEASVGDQKTRDLYKEEE